MERLNTMWQAVSTAVNTAASVRDLAQQARTYTFLVAAAPLTFYLQVEGATINLTRWQEARVEVTTRLQAPFGWRVAAEQDEAGVYVVAKRRTMIENFARGITHASFDIRIPPYMYTTLKLTNCRLIIEDLNGVFNLPPTT